MSKYKEMKDECINELLEFYNDNNIIIKSALRNNNLWIVIERKNSKDRYIILEQLTYTNDGYISKAYIEEDGLNEYNCPKSFLKLQPLVRNENAENWRERLK